MKASMKTVQCITLFIHRIPMYNKFTTLGEVGEIWISDKKYQLQLKVKSNWEWDFEFYCAPPFTNNKEQNQHLFSKKFMNKKVTEWNGKLF